MRRTSHNLAGPLAPTRVATAQALSAWVSSTSIQTRTTCPGGPSPDFRRVHPITGPANGIRA